MTPLGVRYKEAYAKAYPFDRLVEGMLQPEMVLDTVEIMRQGVDKGMAVNVIINNRAVGNAPLITRIANSTGGRIGFPEWSFILCNACLWIYDLSFLEIYKK
jgi:hypothetical protein